MRKALMEVCGASAAEVALYAGHSMRVGGSNHLRRLPDFDPEVHRQLGGWASLACARSYMSLPADEQFKVTRKLGLAEREPGATVFAGPVSGKAVRSLWKVRAAAL